MLPPFEYDFTGGDLAGDKASGQAAVARHQACHHFAWRGRGHSPRRRFGRDVGGGIAARRQAPIDPRNYGVRNFTALFEATGLFDIARAELCRRQAQQGPNATDRQDQLRHRWVRIVACRIGADRLAVNAMSNLRGPSADSRTSAKGHHGMSRYVLRGAAKGPHRAWRRAEYIRLVLLG
jgi:hypothetical protein